MRRGPTWDRTSFPRTPSYVSDSSPPCRGAHYRFSEEIIKGKEYAYLKGLHISVNDRLALLSKHPDGIVLAELLGEVRSHGECV
jgi:hypothetical protein